MRISKYAIYEIMLFHLYIFVFLISFPYKNEWAATILLLLIVASLLFTEYLRTRMFVSPLFFWFGFWLSAISIGRMKLGIDVYPLYQEWSNKLLRIVVGNTVIFFWMYGIGEWVCSRFVRIGNADICEGPRGEVLADIVICLLMTASAAYFLNVLYFGVIPQLTGDANSYRNEFVATRFYQIVGLLRFSLACVPLAYKSTRLKAKKTALVVLAALYLLEEMMTGWRGYTLQSMILLATSFFILSDVNNGKERRRNFILAIGAVVLALVFIVYITVTRDGSFETVSVRVKYAIDNFYLYVAPNFLNFQTCVEKVNPKGYLMYSLEAIWGFIVPAWENPLYIWDDVEFSIGTYNVCTYLLEPYCDLGVAGTFLWSFLIAFFSGLMFVQARVTKKVFSIIAVGITNIAIFMLHNNFFLRSSSVLLWFMAGVAISWILQRRNPVKYEK